MKPNPNSNNLIVLCFIFAIFTFSYCQILEFDLQKRDSSNFTNPRRLNRSL